MPAGVCLTRTRVCLSVTVYPKTPIENERGGSFISYYAKLVIIQLLNIPFGYYISGLIRFFKRV